MKEELLSVGIDLGTSTTQLIFSRLTVENMATSYTVPRMVITRKEIQYKSDIYFTPLLDQTRIDFGKVREIIEREYEKAGIQKDGLTQALSSSQVRRPEKKMPGRLFTP